MQACGIREYLAPRRLAPGNPCVDGLPVNKAAVLYGTVLLKMAKVFEYSVIVHPHHTDYGGVVWHGAYIAWLEEARIAYLQSQGVNFADWVDQGVDLPVVDLSLRYQQPLTLGMNVVVKTWLQPRKGIRLVWQYDLQIPATGATCVLATVTLVPVDRHKRKILRRLPPAVQKQLDALCG